MVIKRTFDDIIPDDFKIIGLRKHDSNNDDSIIPISFVCKNPKQFALKRNQEIIYEIICDNTLPDSIKPFYIRIYNKIYNNKWRSIAVLLCSIIFSYTYTYPWNLFYYFFHKFISHPILSVIYRHGPMISILNIDIGFWSGIDYPTICSMVSGYSSDFWNKNITECQSIYQKKEAAFILLIEISIAVIFGYYIVKAIFSMITTYIKSKIFGFEDY